MYELQEVRASIPFTSRTTGETYCKFDDYYNGVFKAEFDLVNIQILNENESESSYVFWHRYRG
ncbi:MAG: hypothetical protein WD512_16715 [Candidatus Paceibacterota bacterium]